MGSLLSTFNRLLPFATPGTSLVQDLAHLAALCGILYYAPQIQQWLQGSPTHAQDVADEASQADEQLADDIHQQVVEDVGEGIVEELEEGDEPNFPNGQAPNNEDEPQVNDDAQPGPANLPNRPVREVGPKKAKALARKDQRRQYHEFQRAQGDAQRERDAEGASEREAALEAERQRRKAAEAALEAKKAKEREQKREQERKDREEEIRRRELAVRSVKDALEEGRVCDLFKVAEQVGGDVDEEWVEKIITASGMIGRKGDVMTMITGMGRVVRVSAADMAQVYESALKKYSETNGGHISFDTLGQELEAVLMKAEAIVH